MKHTNLRRAFSVALTGVALAATIQVSDAAPENPTAGLTEAVLYAPPEPRHTGRTAQPLTLYMEDSSGNAFRLTHVEGTGWKYADGWKSTDMQGSSLLRKVKFWSKASTQPATETNADEAMTVFIDGPSGFTFVWSREGEWKYVGKIASRRP